MINYKVRALYYVYLVGSPWKYLNQTTDLIAYGYLRHVTGHIYKKHGLVSADTTIVLSGLHYEDKIVKYILGDIGC